MGLGMFDQDPRRMGVQNEILWDQMNPKDHDDNESLRRVRNRPGLSGKYRNLWFWILVGVLGVGFVALIVRSVIGVFQ